MSRITTPPFVIGDPATAAALNQAFTDVATATGTLDAANHRDQAVDLPQLEGAAVVIRNAGRVTLGSGAFDHTVVQNVPSTTVGPATRAEVVDGGTGTPTRLGPVVWPMAEDDVVRVYWDLSVHPVYSGTPWASQNYGDTRYLQDPVPTTLTTTDSFHVWIISLQWDITDATLTNWEDVPAQGDYQTVVGGLGGNYGENLDQVQAQSVVSAWGVFGDPALTGGTYVGGTIDRDQQWRPAVGAWFYSVTGALAGRTIYGFRLVVHGIYHPWRTTTDNFLVLDTGVGGANQKLEVGSGNLVALLMAPG